MPNEVNAEQHGGCASELCFYVRMTFMNRIASTSVYVVAVLALQLTSAAQDGSVPSRSGVLPYSAAPQMNSLSKFAAKRTGEVRLPADAFNGFAGVQSDAHRYPT